MVRRLIEGEAGKLGYDGNLGFIYSDLVEDIEKGRVDYVKIPISDGTFNMFGIDSSIMAILKIKSIGNQLDNIYTELPEDLVDLNGDYNRATLYTGRENPRQIIPKYSEDGYEVEGYEIKGILEDSRKIIYEEDLIERLKNSSSLNLVATKFRSTSKDYGEIEQTLSFEATQDSFKMHLFADPASNGIDLIGIDGMEGFISGLDLYVDSEAMIELRETPLNSGRRFLRRVAKPVTDYLYGF
ncbi:MAG: hypothetical protein KAT28_05670 [Candidatus Aenigmarchaeota archaeon]|nr:hypothetical protein [Candidatus Aenigmarchaeota archaeon]